MILVEISTVALSLILMIYVILTVIVHIYMFVNLSYIAALNLDKMVADLPPMVANGWKTNGVLYFGNHCRTNGLYDM